MAKNKEAIPVLTMKKLHQIRNGHILAKPSPRIIWTEPNRINWCLGFNRQYHHGRIAHWQKLT